jgi:hypothetical protein
MTDDSEGNRQAEKSDRRTLRGTDRQLMGTTRELKKESYRQEEINRDKLVQAETGSKID